MGFISWPSKEFRSCHSRLEKKHCSHSCPRSTHNSSILSCRSPSWYISRMALVKGVSVSALKRFLPTYDDDDDDDDENTLVAVVGAFTLEIPSNQETAVAGAGKLVVAVSRREPHRTHTDDDCWGINLAPPFLWMVQASTLGANAIRDDQKNIHDAYRTPTPTRKLLAAMLCRIILVL